MKFKALFFALTALLAVGCANASKKSADEAAVAQEPAEVVVGAARLDQYVPQLKGKRVALLSNHTGMVGDKHSLDLMLENGVNVTTIFSPEHGFRGMPTPAST